MMIYRKYLQMEGRCNNYFKTLLIMPLNFQTLLRSYIFHQVWMVKITFFQSRIMELALNHNIMEKYSRYSSVYMPRKIIRALASALQSVAGLWNAMAVKYGLNQNLAKAQNFSLQ